VPVSQGKRHNARCDRQYADGKTAFYRFFECVFLPVAIFMTGSVVKPGRSSTVNSPISLEHSFDLYTGVIAPGPATRFVEERREQLFASELEELAGLRFSIVITAKWESSGEEDPQRREELRIELEDLRTRYFDKIDHIAMNFGVAQAMRAKEEVERSVTLPLQVLSAIEQELGMPLDSAPDSNPKAGADGLCF
jgi:hypothetical protein